MRSVSGDEVQGESEGSGSQGKSSGGWERVRDESWCVSGDSGVSMW